MGIINDDKPRTESYDFFENVLRSHDKVKRFIREGEQIYKVIKNNGDTIIVYLTNLYTVGVADYYDIVENNNNITAIVTASNWNSYTREAKEEGKKNRVGVYVIKEFLGALNYDEPYNYVKKDNKGNPIHYWRGGAFK